MSTDIRTRQATRRGQSGANGPALTFALAVLVTFAALVLATGTLPAGLELAAVSSLLFALAAFVALIAWRADQPGQPNLSYRDVAGALTLIGVCAAALMDSDQLVRLIGSQHPVAD